jgi:uncharacterized protein (TIGR02145 family)
MKHIVTIIAIVLGSVNTFAQAPNRISYQAEVRNTSNSLVVNQLVGMRISILQGSTTSQAVYFETHTPTTNANGLISIQIGGGITSGNFASINWGNGPYFLKTETDPTGGTNYSITGTNQLLSVPYALFSNSSNNGVPAGGANGQILTYCNGVPTWTTGGICPGSISALNCATSSNTGNLTLGVASTNVSCNVPYSGGNGGPHNGQTVTSTGVTGLTATLTAGIFTNGTGSLTYTITGTPASSGTASFALNIGGKTCTLTRSVNLPIGTISTLNCTSAVNSGSLTQSANASGVSSTIPYTGGNGGTHNGQTVASTGVTGLTATLTAGVFANGAGNLTYAISGTPSISGTASFALNIGGKTCTLTRTVNLPIGTITTLNCASATNTGSLTQSSIASGVISNIPYTGGNGGTHNGQTVTSTGVTGLTATLTAGVFANGAGSLSYTISGTPTSSGTANFALNIGGKTCTLARIVNLPIGTISTLSCANASNNGTLTQGSVAVSVNSNIPYSGGNGGTYSGQTVTSTGVTGLLATIAAGTFANGSGVLTYTITGTPVGSGTANFALNIGGKACTLSRSVLLLGTISSLNCATAVNSGLLVQGTIASNASSNIPYSGGNGGVYSAQTIPSTGITGLTATIAAGSFALGTGSLNYSITGTPSSGGAASFTLNIGGKTCTLTRMVNATDIEGNSYQTQSIGNQIWMSENLKVSKYRNGESISTGLSDVNWSSTTTGAYAVYNNDAANNISYGKLYNWYAIADPRNVCPTGWHVPSDAEWTTLTTFLGGESVAGGKMKSTGTQFWVSPNVGATNESNFTGLPGGYRYDSGTYGYSGGLGAWWSSTPQDSNNAWYRYLFYYYGVAYRFDSNKHYGYSVRCIKD